MSNKTIRILLVLLVTLFSYQAQAQKLGLRTSATMLATCTPNLEVNYVLSKHVTAHLPVLYNPFVFKENSRFQQLTVMPGARYWFSAPWLKAYVSAYAIASRFHVGGWFDQPYRYNGKCYGGGMGTGYSWIINNHFNIDTEIGFGVAFCDYDKCGWRENSKLYDQVKTTRIFPAKFDISLVYLF